MLLVAIIVEIVAIIACSNYCMYYMSASYRSSYYRSVALAHRATRRAFSAVNRSLCGTLLWVVFGLVNCSVPAAQENTQTDPPAVAPEVVASLLELTLQVDGQAACRTLDMLRDQSLSGQLNGQVLRRIEQAVEPLLSVPRSDPHHAAHYASVLLLAAWGRATELQRMQSWLGDPRVPEQVQGDAVRVIIARKELPLEPVFALLSRSDTPVMLRSRILEELSRSSDDRIGSRLLELYGTLPPSLHGRVIDV